MHFKNQSYTFAITLERVVEDGEIPERSNGTDCKSVASATQVRILLSPQKYFGFSKLFFIFAFQYIFYTKSGSSSVGRATAFQAVGRGFEPRLPLFFLFKPSYNPYPNFIISRRSSGVERFLGKEEVVGSNPIVGSKCEDGFQRFLFLYN